MYCRAHKTATLTSIQHTVHGLQWVWELSNMLTKVEIIDETTKTQRSLKEKQR